jgi:hypothetical protein
MNAQDYKVGDVLVQCKGEPWPTLAWLATGEPYPHAQIVSNVDGPNIWIIESHLDGLQEKRMWTEDWFEVWRPECSTQIKAATVESLRAHTGIVYPYHKIIQVGIGYRLGLWLEAEDFDAQHNDNEAMMCSEAIARHYWRNGYDLVPGVSNRNTLPKDLRNPLRLTHIPG